MFTILATSRVSERWQVTAANPAYPLPNQKSRRPARAPLGGSVSEALVCRWRPSPATGKPECSWAVERITAATGKGADAALVLLGRSTDLTRRRLSDER